MTGPDALLWIAFALAQLADVLTTRRALAAGLREVNPIWRWMQARLGRSWWVPRIAGAWALAGALWWHLGPVPVAIMAVGIGVVAANNWRLTRRARK